MPRGARGCCSRRRDRCSTWPGSAPAWSSRISPPGPARDPSSRPRGWGPRGSTSPPTLPRACPLARAGEPGLTNVATLVVDAQAVSFPPGSCDAVISRFGLMFMPRQQGGARRHAPRADGGREARRRWAGSAPGALPCSPCRWRSRGVTARRAGPECASMMSSPRATPGPPAAAFERAGFRDIREHAVALETRGGSAGLVASRGAPLGPLNTVPAGPEGRDRARRGRGERGPAGIRGAGRPADPGRGADRAREEMSGTTGRVGFRGARAGARRPRPTR